MNHIRCAIHNIPEDIFRADTYVSSNCDVTREFRMVLHYRRLPITRIRVLLDVLLDYVGCTYYDKGSICYGSPPMDSHWRE